MPQRRPMERFAAYRAQPVRGQVHLNRAEVEKLAGALHGVHAEHESLLRTLGENISEKLKIASKQPIEYGAYFLITSVVPFIDETSAAAVISSLSKKIGGHGGRAQHYSAALERNRRGKPLAGGNFPRPDFANVLRARRKPVV